MEPTEQKPADVWQAEKDKLAAEALAASTDATVNQATARKLAAEAFQEEARARKAAIDLEKTEREYAIELTKDEHNHVYAFTEKVVEGSAGKCMSALKAWMRQDAALEEKSPIEIWFFSPGGEVIPGMALYDTILQVRRAGHHVTTICLGYAASMAGILLQAGDTRVMGQESYILIHEISFGAGGKIGEVEDEVAFVKKIQKRVIAIFAARSKLSAGQIQNKWRRKDWWLDSAEALRLGLVDEIR